jgi:hypothetical protein
MARILDRRIAIKLRQEGKSWTYIKDLLSLNRGTLTRWLKDVELTDEQKEKIFKESKVQRIERYIVTVKARRQRIIDSAYLKEKKILGRISKRDFLIAGLFLYLGEGSKSDWWRIIISNSNPTIIRFSVFWLNKILGIPVDQLRIQVHLYYDMDIKKEVNFWLKTTGLKKSQIIKPYIKKTSSKAIDHATFGHGTCNVYTSNTKLKNKIMAAINVILNTSERTGV